MDQEERNLWRLYRQTNRRELLEKIVERNLNIVHYLANKLFVFATSTLDRDDLYSAGVMGLLEAISKYDPEKGIEFQTFATIRIRGAIIDEIRKTDWVPRTVRQKAKKIDAAIHALFTKLERMPSDTEIAEELEIPVEEYYQITDNLGPLFLSSLDAAVVKDKDGSEVTISDIIEDTKEASPEDQHYEARLRSRIAEAISQLPEKEKLVIALYYYEELNLKEIGMVLDVTESRVSQMHSSAVMKLRNILQHASTRTFV